MLNYLRALIVAVRAHKGQHDKAGRAYIWHPIRVAMMVHGSDAKIVAILHDVIEDSECTLKDLPFLPLAQREALLLLTKDKDADYEAYINKIAENPIAKAVKIADLKHNSNLKRLSSISQNDIARKEKYIKALRILTA